MMKLVISILIPLAVGAIAGFFTAESVNTWYAGLQKPSFNPPNWIFGPVWTSLYVLMGIGLYLVWKQPASAEGRNAALTIFWIQLLLNFCWSFIFFKLKETGWAFADIVALWISIITMIIFFHRVSSVAAFLQLPYLLWVSFASVLNAAIWQLNK